MTLDGVYFDAESVAIDTLFFESLTITKSTKSGGPERIKLLKHARRLFANVLGWKRPDGYRLYRHAFWSMARKNIKTQGAAMLGLRELVLGEESSPEIYTAAKDREQAGICFEAAAAMIRAEPELDFEQGGILRVTPYAKEIRNTLNDGKLKALSSEGKGKHGFNPSCVIFDEFHVWGPPEEELHAALTTGSVARKQPLFLYITTAGVDEQTMCGREYDYAKRVIAGITKDPNYYADIYEVPRDADWTDETLWHLANPTLGDVVTLEALREACAKAKEMPAKQTDFRRLALNQWVNTKDIWIPQTRWDACSWKSSDPIPATADWTSQRLAI